MAIKLKSTVSFDPVVESISRKFVPRKEKCIASTSKTAGSPIAFAGQGFMGGYVKKTYRAGLGACESNTLFIRANARMTPISANEIAQRERFARIVAARKAIKQDLTQISQMQVLWATANKDASKTLNGVSAYGYTYDGWIFAVQMAGLVNNPEYNVSQFPTAFDA